MGVAGGPRGEPAVRDGAARERGRRRSAYEAPHGSVAPRIRVQRRRIEAETVPPLPCTAVSGPSPSLGACPSNRRHDVKALLDVPAAVEVVAIVPLGHPADRFGPTRRKPVAEVAFRERWGKPFVADGGGGA